jgi:hypothetical protein
MAANEEEHACGDEISGRFDKRNASINLLVHGIETLLRKHKAPVFIRVEFIVRLCF